jgi:GTPase SAR1 family protein
MNDEDTGNSIMMVRQKIVFVGDISVGKTSVMSRFTENKFRDHYDVKQTNIANHRR